MTEGQEIAHVGSFEYVAATHETVWSAEEFRIYGLDPSGPSPAYEEMLAKSYLPEDAALLHQTFSAAMQVGGVYELEHRLLRADGSIRWVYDRAHPHFDKDGKLIRYVGATVDITDRKRADERLRRFYETDLFAILYWKIDGGVVDVNDQFLKMTGYTREDVKGGGVNWAQMTPPEYHAMDDDARRQIMETGVHRPYEKEYIRKDGTRVWGMFWAAAYEDDRTQGVSFILDITARKRAEVALRESEAKYRNLFENMTEEVHFWKVVRDEAGQIKTWRLVDANPPTLKTWGRKTVEEIRQDNG